MHDRKHANRQVRVEDVAREAGVSPITVSRALSTPEKVKAETRERVAAAVAKTGYVVNNNASTLRSGRSSIVSVFVSNLANPHFAAAIQGCQDALEGSRYRLLMAQTGYSDALQDTVVAEVLPFRPAGAIFTGLVQSERTRVSLAGLGIPVVEMWDYRPDPIDMLVGFSNAEGGQMLGGHFAARGYRKIAYAGRVHDRGAHRLAGFRDRLEANGVQLGLVLPVEERFSVTAGMAALDAVLAQMPDCEAVFFSSDILAAGGMLRARQVGIDVPKDLAIAGFGDLDFSANMAVPLTTVHVNGYEMGQRAGKMLLQRLQGQHVDEPVVVSPISLMVRESTGL